ncbi:MAG: hypothetical protein KJ065_19565 [Anaerolineae bacterium]|nr:hypothetical protein [Anaerolineae bacterium]
MRRVGSIIIIFLVLWANRVVVAQDEQPLVFWASGDLWLWSPSAPAITALTTDGTISSPSLAPSGGQIAYRALPSVSREALGRLQTSGLIAEYDLPADLFLVDLNTRQSILIAAQPAAASLFVEGVADNALVRSEPAWSPAGDALAWVEFPFGAAEGSLFAYSLSSASPQVIATDIPITSGRAPELRWGSPGIVLRSAGDDTGAQVFQLYALDTSGWITLQTNVPEDTYVQLFDWVASPQGELLGILLSNGRWQLLDPRTGAEGSAGTPALYSRFDAASSLALRFDVAPETGFFWETVVQSAQTASAAFSGAPGQVAVAPDSRTLAFIGYPEFGALALWQEGVIINIAGTGSSDPAFQLAAIVFWSPLEWRLAHE